MIEYGSLAYALEAQGRRPSMEDAYVLDVRNDPFEVIGAIFDGHSGAAVAKRAAGSFLEVFTAQREKVREAGIGVEENALSATFAILQEEAARISQIAGGGACACAFFVSKDKIVTANLGDAEIAFLPDDVYRGAGLSGPNVQVLTTAHRLDNPDEILRVYHADAVIKKPYFGDGRMGLMPTRALGDTSFDALGMSHVPAINMKFRRDPYVSFHAPGTLVAACDGFWDVVKAEDLDELTRHLDRDAQRITQRLFDEALTNRQTTDNLTVIGVRVE